MSLPYLFATGVRIQLLEAGPGLKTAIVRDRYAFGVLHTVSLGVVCPEGIAYASLYNPKDRRVGFGVSIDPPEACKTIIYATRQDILPLTQVAAALLLDPVAQSNPSTVVWYTPAAGRECSNPDMNANGIVVPETVVARPPHTGDLFRDPEFWMRLRALRDDRGCMTPTGALADFVERRGFDRLAGLLRTDPKAALKVLPGKSLCPQRFKPWPTRRTTFC